MPPRVPIDDRRLIACLFVEGVPQREIARRTGRSKSAVARTIRVFRNGGSLADSKRPGRPRASTEEDDLLIIAASVADPFMTAEEIRKELALNISAKTIRRRLKEIGLRSCMAAQKPHLTTKQRKERLEFANSLKGWTVDDWSEVIFSDESSFSTRWDQKCRVWRPVNCRYGYPFFCV